jgi:hypothetical protein
VFLFIFLQHIVKSDCLHYNQWKDKEKVVSRSCLCSFSFSLIAFFLLFMLLCLPHSGPDASLCGPGLLPAHRLSTRHRDLFPSMTIGYQCHDNNIKTIYPRLQTNRTYRYLIMDD